MAGVPASDTKCDVFAAFDAGSDLLHSLMFVELVVRLHLVLYLKMFQQNTGCAGMSSARIRSASFSTDGWKVMSSRFPTESVQLLTLP